MVDAPSIIRDRSDSCLVGLCPLTTFKMREEILHELTAPSIESLIECAACGDPIRAERAKVAALFTPGTYKGHMAVKVQAQRPDNPACLVIRPVGVGNRKLATLPDRLPDLGNMIPEGHSFLQSMRDNQARLPDACLGVARKHRLDLGEDVFCCFGETWIGAADHQLRAEHYSFRCWLPIRSGEFSWPCSPRRHKSQKTEKPTLHA